MKRKAGKKALVIGAGNILLKDEGIGVRVLKYLTDAYAPPDTVECIDGGTAGINLLDHIKGFTHVIIIDAVSSPSPPGTIVKISGKDLEKAPAPTLGTTAHQVGLMELMALASFEGRKPSFTVIGVVPKDIRPGLELTSLVRKKVPEAAEAVKGELQKLGFSLKERKRYA